MRVLTVGNMYPPHHMGGYELMWQSSVRRLAEWGHDVRVLTTDYRADGGECVDGGEVVRDLRWYWHEHEFPRMGPAAIVGLERHNRDVLMRELGAFRPDVVSWWAMGGMSLSLIEQVRRAGIPAAFAVVDDWLLYGPKVDRWAKATRRSGPLAAALEPLAGVPARFDLARAGVWLLASRTLVERARCGGWELPRLRVAYPGIDHALFRDPRPPRADWTWNLLYCGRIDDRKGIDVAVEALPHLPDEARLRVVGGGDEEHLGALRALVNRLALWDRVSFERHPRAELPRVYADADVTIFPVRWEEPFGLVPLESMAVGTPVAASGRGGSGEYLRDGENSVLFDVDRGAEALAAAVRRVAENATVRARLHEGGLATARRFRAEDFDRAVEASLTDAGAC